MRMVKGVLLFSLIAVVGSGAPAVPRPGSLLFPPMQLTHNVKGKAHFQSHRRGLAKKSAVMWEQTGTVYYINDDTVTGGPADWAFSSRDTTIYDANGRRIVSKASNANTGWAIDSLEYLDSSVYSGGVLTESIYEYFSNTSGVVSASGDRQTYGSFDGGKSFVMIYYNWNDSKKTWVPSTKDSMVYSVSGGSNGFISDYSNLLGLYYWSYDTAGSSWTTSQAFARVDAECNATTLTLGGKKLVAANKLGDAKEILTFNSSVWTYSNLIQDEDQVKDTVAGTYHDQNKFTYTMNANGSETDQSFYWNATTATLVPMSKDSTTYDASGLELSDVMWNGTATGLAISSIYLYYPDSHGNDTLDAYYSYSSYTTAVDTSMYRYARTYDANGNNSVTIVSNYGPVYDADYNVTGMAWFISGKEVNTFAQVTTPVLRPGKQAVKPGISVFTTASRVIIKAPAITGLMLYNAEGRMVASVRQQAAGSISLDLSGNTSVLSSGIYLAKLMRGAEQSSFRLPIRR